MVIMRFFSEPMRNDFRYYAIDPSCMNIRICMFWFLWAMLIVVLVVSILSYCCVVPKMCDSFGKIITLNATNTVSMHKRHYKI